MKVLHHFPEKWLVGVVEAVPEVVLIEVPAEGEVPGHVSGDLLLTSARGCPNLLEFIDRGVRWVHTLGTGVDEFPLELIDDVPLTCSRGASAVPIAEWCLAQMLAFEKQLPERWLDGPPDTWLFADLGTLEGKTLGLVGLGGIGSAVARRALAFDMRVVAYRRTGAASIDGVDVRSDLRDVLQAADHLVLAAPSTSATRQLVGADALAIMKPGVHLVNVARGDLVDQDALRSALDEGIVARASLDVATPEPVPPGHWLYSHPQVRLSAHVSWNTPAALDRLMESFVDNLQRFRSGRPLTGLVNLEEGY